MLTPLPASVPETATAGDVAASPPRRPYPSDVTDDQWRVLQRLLAEPAAATGRPRTVDLREVVSALCYRWRTECPWRMLPHDFPPWETVYTYYRRWERTGVLTELRARLIGRRADEPDRS